MDLVKAPFAFQFKLAEFLRQAPFKPRPPPALSARTAFLFGAVGNR